MAIYHCSCKIIGRSNGRSAVGAAAYRSGDCLVNEYDGLVHDYRNKGGIVHAEIMLCKNAPKEYADRATLWNAVESAEKSSVAQLSREFEVALPRELNRAEQIELVRNFVQSNFVDKGMCADIAIHDKEDGNPHAHIMLTMRQIDENGKWKSKEKKVDVRDENGERIPIIDKKTGLQKVDSRNRKQWKREYVQFNEWNKPEFLQSSREQWAVCVNRELEKKNLPDRVDHRSFKEQGKEKIPTKHIGVAALSMERRGAVEISDQRQKNIDIQKDNAAIEKVNENASQTAKEISSAKREIAFIRSDMAWNKVHEKTASWETALIKISTSEKSLHQLQATLEKSKQQLKDMKPTNDYGRTVNYDLREIPYFEYHRNKAVGDISFLQNRVKGYLEILEQKRQQEPKQEQSRPTAAPAPRPAEQRTVKGDPPKAAELPSTAPAPYDSDTAARQIAQYKSDFVKATVQSKQRTVYQENTIYSTQATAISDYAKRVAEQSEAIKTLTAERNGLGLFDGRKKKALQEKIDSFSSLRKENIDKLKALGVSDPAKASEAVKEKKRLAAEEKDKAQAAKLNEGAGERAAQAKAALLECAERVPAAHRQEVLNKVEQYKDTSDKEQGMKGMEYYKAEAEARRLLTAVLKNQSHDIRHERSRGIEHER